MTTSYSSVFEPRPVLDKGHVILVDVMPDPEKLPLDRAVVQAARASTVAGWTGRYSTGLKSPAADKKLLRYLWENGHLSPWEMLEFKFHVKAPLMVFRQWQRHRTWNYNEQSGRYQEYQDEFYVPSTWRRQDLANRQGSQTGALDKLDDVFLTRKYEARWSVALADYQDALDRGVAREQARIFLPAFALYSEMYAKVDARNLLHFLKERTSPAAQHEIRQYALAIAGIVRDLMPWTYELAFKETDHD